MQLFGARCQSLSLGLASSQQLGGDVAILEIKF
jgi:hypothetical protein